MSNGRMSVQWEGGDQVWKCSESLDLVGEWASNRGVDAEWREKEGQL